MRRRIAAAGGVLLLLTSWPHRWKRQRVAPNGSCVATPTTVSIVKRYTCHGGGPALGALNGAVSAPSSTRHGQPPSR